MPEAFEEGNGLGVAASFDGARLFGLGYEAVSVNDRGAALALAHAAARLKRLFEREPALRRIAMFDHRAPQDQHIDARVTPGRKRVARETGAGRAAVAIGTSRGTGCRPRLNPRETTCLKLGDDPGGDLVIEVDAGRFGLASGLGRGWSSGAGRGGFPARAARAMAS